LPIKKHSDFASKTCPGKNFDMSSLLPNVVKDPAGDTMLSKTITFNVSRYYAPVEGQSRYYNNRTYLEDVKMNCGLNKDGTA